MDACRTSLSSDEGREEGATGGRWDLCNLMSVMRYPAQQAPAADRPRIFPDSAAAAGACLRCRT